MTAQQIERQIDRVRLIAATQEQPFAHPGQPGMAKQRTRLLCQRQWYTLFLAHAQPVRIARLLQQVQCIRIRQAREIPLDQCQGIISGQVLPAEVLEQPFT